MVIGGTGLIGEATATLLVSQDIDVAVFGRRASTAQPADGRASFRGDVTSQDDVRTAFRAFRPERVLHLASLLQFECETQPRSAVDVNVHGLMNVLDACAEFGAERFVFGSSVAVYGGSTAYSHEAHGVGPGLGIYGAAKLLGEALSRRAAQLGRYQCVALRYVGVFGGPTPHSAGMAAIRHKLLRCMWGENVTIEGASGDERVHLTHVDDAAKATVGALLHGGLPYSVYNVAGPRENCMSLSELHGVIGELCPGAGSVTWRGPRGPDAGPLDTTRLTAEVGYQPHVTVRSGLRKMLEQEPLNGRGRMEVANTGYSGCE